MVDACINFRKKLSNRNLFHRGDADDLQNFPEAVWQVQPPFGNGYQEVGTDSGPHLYTDTVGRCAIKAAKPQVLLDPPKEQFDRPSASIDLSDKQRFQIELVRDENQLFGGFRIDEADAAEFLWIVSTADRGVECDRLVGAQPGRLVHWATFAGIKAGVRFESGNEECTGLMQPIQAGEIQIAAAMPYAGICRIPGLVTCDSNAHDAA